MAIVVNLCKLRMCIYVVYIPGTCLSSILVVEPLNPPKQVVSNQSKGHLGSKYINVQVPNS